MKQDKNSQTEKKHLTIANMGIVQDKDYKILSEKKAGEKAENLVHSLGKRIICDTESRGFSTPQGKTPLEIVLDSSDGFIPLWAAGVTVNWRFQERSLIVFDNPEQIKTEVRRLLGVALMKWGDAAPIKFAENDDAWDFEIVIRSEDNCNSRGCVLASAFFPDAGRHEFVIYPKMFGQSEKETIDTLIHETGHIFGLRHFFAQIYETQWASEIFGTHNQFSIMNYGELSDLTDADKSDLTRLYNLVWSGKLKDINGTPVKLFRPFHENFSPFGSLMKINNNPLNGNQRNFTEKTDEKVCGNVFNFNLS